MKILMGINRVQLRHSTFLAVFYSVNPANQVNHSLAPCGDKDCKTFTPKAGQKIWVKIDQGGWHKGTKMKFASDDLIAHNNTWTSTFLDSTMQDRS